jgi:flagellar hook-associated protein 2
MPGISVSGLGSGLDVNNLVSQLVAAEKQPVQQRLAAAESKAQVRLSALGTYRAALANLQAAAADLKTGSALGALTASSSDSSLFGASAAGAAAGRYSVEVVSLARANRLASGTFAGSTSALGAGDVTLTVAGESFTVSLAQGSDTLADLRDAINNASNNSGVSATLINESGGTRLLLSARNTGLANSVSVSSTLLAFSETQGASDAHVRVDGYDAFSAVNSVSGVIDGVTLKLVKAAPGTLATLDVAVDNKSAADAVQKFVGAYNALIVTANSLSRFDVATQTAAALTGDSTVRSAGLQLRALLGGASVSWRRSASPQPPMAACRSTRAAFQRRCLTISARSARCSPAAMATPPGWMPCWTATSIPAGASKRRRRRCRTGSKTLAIRSGRLTGA